MRDNYVVSQLATNILTKQSHSTVMSVVTTNSVMVMTDSVMVMTYSVMVPVVVSKGNSVMSVMGTMSMTCSSTASPWHGSCLCIYLRLDYS